MICVGHGHTVLKNWSEEWPLREVADSVVLGATASTFTAKKPHKPSQSALPSPLYVCYLNQAEGLVSATNCSVASSPIADDEPLISEWTLVLIYLVFCSVFGCILLYRETAVPLLIWCREAKDFLRGILFWHPVPKPEEVSESEPETNPESEASHISTQAYLAQIKQSCSPHELLLWNRIITPRKYNKTTFSTHTD